MWCSTVMDLQLLKNPCIPGIKVLSYLILEVSKDTVWGSQADKKIRRAKSWMRKVTTKSVYAICQFLLTIILCTPRGALVNSSS